MVKRYRHKIGYILMLFVTCLFLTAILLKKHTGNEKEQTIGYSTGENTEEIDSKEIESSVEEVNGIFSGLKQNNTQTVEYIPKVIVNETNDSAVEEGRMPAPIQYDPEIMDYDPEDTIYYKTYYDDFQEGKIMNIKYSPHMEIRKELEDYFFDASEIFYLDYLVGMFYDNRTIETDEKELEQLFLNHGYIIYFHNAEFQDFHLRFVEIAEKEGLSLFPIRILMQTWDDDFIYLQDITGPIPRKIRDLMVVDKDGVWQLIVHSSGFSKELIPEEELSFWKFTGTYWILVPMELEIDTTHAFFEDYPLYPDIDRDELFEANFYRDGIAYRPDMQPYNKWGSECAYRLGKMEIVEENRSFRLYTVTVEGQPHETSSYIQYTIK